ncbi:MAG: DUF523 domain-containing protein [Lachnospiraceae bacterium]|nr:DUF523 domain-containing protein [Lachnospiraceae bacterium]
MYTPEKPAILVSACLLGSKCRYNGKGELHEDVQGLMSRCHPIPVCPEIYGGLPTPRIPSERSGNRVIGKTGEDVTAQYEKGARETLHMAQLYHCPAAILKERSPSCGSGQIYDGTHTRTLIPGDGVTTELLRKHGIAVFGESETDKLEKLIDDMERM